MPAAPHVSVLTTYVFENPWPVSLILLAVATVFGWIGFREGIPRRIAIAVGLTAVAGVVLALGFLVETSGERAREVVRSFVEAVVKKDLVSASGMIADSAVLSAGSPSNAGLDADAIIEGLSSFADRYTIESNDITMLRGYGEGGNAATVHLGCYTVIDYPTVSKWVLRVQEQEGGAWKITRITCISINDHVPSLDWMR